MFDDIDAILAPDAPSSPIGYPFDFPQWDLTQIAEQGRPVIDLPLDWGAAFESVEPPRPCSMGPVDLLPGVEFAIDLPSFCESAPASQDATPAPPSVVPTTRRPSPPKPPIIYKPFASVEAPEVTVRALRRVMAQRILEQEARAWPPVQGVQTLQ
jgi:hypothetical protein